ncbi:mannonate dehydratase [Pelagicoccus mobilis]|uniref:mannonate dehydratase n=1 Tax=Pelagicoccus mobilis TaxID=415221 RepID=A0A934VRW0_9BACT|nr:mannonate dehydratase [Pelagicoccus mobilis]MBK1878375.1 mannonate dehydratase [Pelagicoccus mobilis]
MKIGLGLYKHMLTPENFRFAKQAGATHIVAHLVDYFKGDEHSGGDDQPTGGDRGWGLAGDPDTLWSLEDLKKLREDVEANGLILEAIENFDPAHWHDILLDGPKRDQHISNVKTIIRRLGEAGIPTMGYNFSIAGVAGRTTGPYARGQADSVGMEGPYDEPIPNGMAWNMVYDLNAAEGTIPSVTHEELWRRLRNFLAEVLPVAEQSGVTLAAHPDDPPMPTIRSQPRLVHQPHLYQDLIDANPSPRNKLEFCIGSIAEMTEGDVYQAIDQYSSQNRIGYIHFRNVRGKVPYYKETFIDDGDIDMLRALEILHTNGYQGVLIPDHCPSMSCDAPWHAGMAYALGYIKAALQSIESKSNVTPSPL